MSELEKPKAYKQKEFFEAMSDRSLKQEFYAAIKKEPKDLTPIEVKALIKRCPQLSDNERFKFRHILIWENLTDEEINRLERIYPARSDGSRVKIYFPNKDDVEEHYKKHFLRGRTASKPVVKPVGIPAKPVAAPVAKPATKPAAKLAPAPAKKPAEGDGK